MGLAHGWSSLPSLNRICLPAAPLSRPPVSRPPFSLAAPPPRHLALLIASGACRTAPTRSDAANADADISEPAFSAVQPATGREYAKIHRTVVSVIARYEARSHGVDRPARRLLGQGTKGFWPPHSASFVRPKPEAAEDETVREGTAKREAQAERGRRVSPQLLRLLHTRTHAHTSTPSEHHCVLSPLACPPVPFVDGGVLFRLRAKEMGHLTHP